MKKISIGVPCYNEELNIKNMYEAILSQMRELPEYDYEIIFADNASTDNSKSILRDIAEKDKHVKIIINQANFGVYRSSVNCYKNSSGDAYIGIPCDFQEPPDMIPIFVKEWEKGNSIVWGQKTKSKEGFLKYSCRKLYYKIMDTFADYPQMSQVDGFGIMDKKVVDFLVEMQLQDPEFTSRQLFPEFGFDVKLIPYTQEKRRAGKSSYSIGGLYHFSITSLCNSSSKVLHIISILGFTSSVVCILVAIFFFVKKLIFWHEFNMGIAPIVIGIFLTASIQLLCIGIIGEYINVLLRRVTKKPLVIEKEKINFDE